MTSTTLPRIPWFPALAVTLALAAPARAGFIDATSSAGLLWYQTSWGAALADIDGDGTLDVYAGHHAFEPVIFWNDGTGHFDSTIHTQPWSGAADRHGMLPISIDFDEDVELFITHGGQGGAGTEANELYRNDGGGVLLSLLGAGGMDDPPGRARCVSAADFNGDYLVDLWLGKAPDAVSKNSLFRNDGLFNFHDVAAAAGVDEGWGTVGGIWGDIDDDGDPDLLVGGEEFARPTVFFRNDGGTFLDASSMFSPALPVVSGADWGDYDNDGDLDLAVCDGQIGIFDTYSEGDSVSFFFNTRYSEDGVDALTVPAHADTAYAAFHYRGLFDFDTIFLGPSAVNPVPGPWVVLTDDYVGAPSFTPGVDLGIFVWRDGAGGDWQVQCSTPNVNFDTFDGWLTDGTTLSGVTPQYLEDPGFVSGRARVWRNDGSGFLERTGVLGLPSTFENPRDVSWVDYDNDGDLDLHVVDMGTTANPNAPDALFRNDGTVFVDRAPAEGITGGTSGMGDGGVWGDLDEDGHLDLYLKEGAGPTAYSAFGPSLYLRNDGASGFGSLQLDLVGRQSGKAAIGTKVTVIVGGQTIVRRKSANSWRGFADSPRVHVGLGAAASADSVIVEWPRGTVDVYTDLPAGKFRMEEGGIGVAAPVGPDGSDGWRLEGLRPQPASGEQRIVLVTARATGMRVTIHDVSGRLVRRLHDGRLPAGTTSLAWDGRDDAGRPVAAGVYFVRADGGRDTVVRKSVRVH